MLAGEPQSFFGLGSHSQALNLSAWLCRSFYLISMVFLQGEFLRGSQFEEVSDLSQNSTWFLLRLVILRFVRLQFGRKRTTWCLLLRWRTLWRVGKISEIKYLSWSLHRRPHHESHSNQLGLLLAPTVPVHPNYLLILVQFECGVWTISKLRIELDFSAFSCLER